MTPLAELQQSFAHAMLGDARALPGRLFARAPVSAVEALAVHRLTIRSALCRALALSFPTVRAATGMTFFNQAALAYAAEHPPRAPSLAAYGGDFPAFLDGWPLAAVPPWLGDLARLDLAIERTAASPVLGAVHPIDDGVAMSLPVSLQVLELGFAVDEIRDAAEAGDEVALALADPEPGPRWLAVWRAGPGASARALSPSAGVFLRELLAGAGAEAAMRSAAGGTTLQTALLAIQAEVFAAPFTQIIQSSLQREMP